VGCDDSAGSDRSKTGDRMPKLMGETVDVVEIGLGAKLEIEITSVMFWCLTAPHGIIYGKVSPETTILNCNPQLL
jgi:hypothetical protein